MVQTPLVNHERSSFSAAALAILDQQVFAAASVAQYDPLAGGLRWADEFPAYGTPDWIVVTIDYKHRRLIAYRAALTIGAERAEFRDVWQQVVAGAPHWPGLHPDRRGAKVRDRLLAAKRLEQKCLDAEAGGYLNDGPSSTT